jgi:hypothetical protein
MMTKAFYWAETGLTFAALSLLYWFAPPGEDFGLMTLFSEDATRFAQLAVSIAYFLVVLFLEPFYVAAGFGMYLNRRAELEAWDIEQEFRRAFAG